jgi:hypothetical protein
MKPGLYSLSLLYSGKIDFYSAIAKTAAKP